MVDGAPSQVHALEQWTLPPARWRQAGIPVASSATAVHGAAVLSRPGVQLSTLWQSPSLAADLPACIGALAATEELATTVATECKYRSCGARLPRAPRPLRLLGAASDSACEQVCAAASARDRHACKGAGAATTADAVAMHECRVGTGAEAGGARKTRCGQACDAFCGGAAAGRHPSRLGGVEAARQIGGRNESRQNESRNKCLTRHYLDGPNVHVCLVLGIIIRCCRLTRHSLDEPNIHVCLVVGVTIRCCRLTRHSLDDSNVDVYRAMDIPM